MTVTDNARASLKTSVSLPTYLHSFAELLGQMESLRDRNREKQTQAGRVGGRREKRRGESTVERGGGPGGDQGRCSPEWLRRPV